MKITKDGYYGPYAQHTYDLANPYDKRYLLVLVHGGGWVGGDKHAPNFNNGDDVLTVATEHGIAVASINYTLATEDEPTAPTNTSPNVLDNIRVAVETLKREVNPDRTVLLGTSAGANLAALAFQRYPDLIDGFIGFYGAYDLNESYRVVIDFSPTVQDMIQTFTGGEQGKLDASSPDYYGMDDRPPVLLFHGDQDTTVYPRQSIMMARTKDKLVIVKGKGHAFKPFDSEHIDCVIDYVKGDTE
jgi:acetyl esterase/lipase